MKVSVMIRPGEPMTPQQAADWLEDNADKLRGCNIKAEIIHDGIAIAKFSSRVWVAVGDFIAKHTHSDTLVSLALV